MGLFQTLQCGTGEKEKRLVVSVDSQTPPFHNPAPDPAGDLGGGGFGAGWGGVGSAASLLKGLDLERIWPVAPGVVVSCDRVGSFGLMEFGINAGAVEAGLRWGACPRTKEGKATEGEKGEGGVTV